MATVNWTFSHCREIKFKEEEWSFPFYLKRSTRALCQLFKNFSLFIWNFISSIKGASLHFELSWMKMVNNIHIPKDLCKKADFWEINIYDKILWSLVSICWLNRCTAFLSWRPLVIHTAQLESGLFHYNSAGEETLIFVKYYIWMDLWISFLLICRNRKPF